MSRSWTVLGPGRCGLQLARAMRAKGIHVSGVALRSAEAAALVEGLLPGVAVLAPGDRLPTEGSLLVTVPDENVGSVAEAVARRHSHLPSLALHTSGVLPGRALAALHERGVQVGSFHPLVSFPSADGPLVPLEGVTAVLEGRPAAVAAGTDLARSLGMRPHRIAAGAKPLYHAAAAIAGNLTHAIVRLAAEQMEAAGFGPEDAVKALAPLIASAVRAALDARDWSLLTGAIARADAATVRTHLTALPEDVTTVYRAVAQVAIERLATAGNIDRSGVEALRAALTTGTLCASVPVVRRREGN